MCAPPQHVMADAGHACYVEQPEAFHAALLPWLAEQDAARPAAPELRL
jgi:hypothetical protein